MASKKSSDKAARPDVAALREMNAEELESKLKAQREDLMNARFKHSVAQFEKTSDLKAMRRQIARISTVLNEKVQEA